MACRAGVCAGAARGVGDAKERGQTSTEHRGERVAARTFSGAPRSRGSAPPAYVRQLSSMLKTSLGIAAAATRGALAARGVGQAHADAISRKPLYGGG